MPYLNVSDRLWNDHCATRADIVSVYENEYELFWLLGLSVRLVAPSEHSRTVGIAEYENMRVAWAYKELFEEG